MANKITTQGYFKKRLRDSGYKVMDVFKTYNYLDPRAWTLLIDPGGASIFCTCYINYDDRGHTVVELYDGGQFIPGRLKIDTSSIEVIMDKLNSFDLVNKSRIDSCIPL